MFNNVHNGVFLHRKTCPGVSLSQLVANNCVESAHSLGKRPEVQRCSLHNTPKCTMFIKGKGAILFVVSILEEESDINCCLCIDA